MIPNSIIYSALYPPATLIFLCKIVFSSVVFLPTIALHFSIEYLKDNAEPSTKRDLIIAYFFTVVFLVLLWATDDFVSGLFIYNWGTYPKGGYIHALHSVFVVATAIYMVHILWKGMQKIKQKEGKTKKYHETKYVFIAFLFITVATVDFMPSWGINISPVGFIFVIIFLASTSYAIFKHELLGITIVIKKSLLYSILISVVASVYFSIVYLLSRLIGDLTKVQSVPVILVTLSAITLIFKPLEQKIQKMIDKLFFKPREEIEKENQLLLNEVKKQDQMRAVSTLAAGMAHEIKNPLTTIKTFIEFLPEKYDDPQFRSTFCRIVTDEADRVNNIVKQLLEFARPKDLELKLEPITVILDETIGLLSSNFLKSKIEVIKDYQINPRVYVDKGQLTQAFVNIALNAIQAMPDGGQFTVTTSSWLNNHLRISFLDSGEGIAKDKLDRIFEPFFTTKETGTGLGLSIVHGLIKEHGGKIEVESQPNKGTCFNVLLRADR